MCGLAAKTAWRRWCRGRTRPFWSDRVDRVGGIVVNSKVLSLAVSLVFRCVKWRVKPVHSSTSISNSVILRCGSSIAVWSIMACAASGTAASSGVIFRPDAVVMMASGKSLAAAMRLTVASCASNNSNRSCRYWSQSVATASGNSLASFKVANFSTGTVFVEVLELARTLHPDITGAQRVLQLRQGA